MSVLEYALDIKKDVEVVLEKCKELGIDVKTKDDYLNDDAIVLLDDEFALEISNDETDDYIEEDIEEELLEEELLIEESKKLESKGSKKAPKKQVDSNVDFNLKKKEMYKHKEKLKSNAKEENIILYNSDMTVSDLANILNISVTEIIKKLMNLGIMMTINSKIDYDAAEIIASEYKKELRREETRDETNFEEFEIVDKAEDLQERPAVVTIMGHVDHGKTTLLDTIRKSDVVSGEAGGITQHIGAYQVTYNDKKITFIDTPGHEAFTEMRARGASITDIVIIIVAADDGVMPQTIEAIDHAKAAKVPIIVAINKIDKPNANPDRIMTEMANNGLTPEEWGGDVMFVPISAKTGEGIDNLLERILLIAEMSELKANPNRYALGSVIEAKIDKNVGSVVTLLIQNGTLRLGDPIVVGNSFGKIRTLKNDKGENLVEALPSTPVSITGLNEVPSAGDRFFCFESEKKAKMIAEERKIKAKTNSLHTSHPTSLDEIFSKINEGVKEINILLKADVKGSEEAVKNSLLKIDVSGVRVNIIRSSVGAITESDIILAGASNAIIIGFNVRPNNKIMEFAKERNVEIRLYNIIYKVVEEIEQAMIGSLDPTYEEKVLGEATVRKIFKFSKIGTIAGSYITSGIIKRDAKARIIRDGIVIYDGKINSIAREKDQVKEVKQGLECGITIENYNDIKENDIIEAYEIVEVKGA